MRACSFALLETRDRHNLNGILPRPAAWTIYSVMDVAPAAVIHFVAHSNELVLITYTHLAQHSVDHPLDEGTPAARKLSVCAYPPGFSSAPTSTLGPACAGRF